ncbi:hypothetical protein [Photobacterium leiognathi]|nr:hypothetical protein [Photobacterium leiognathi]
MITTRSQETNVKLWVEILIFLCSYYPLFLILFIKDINNNTDGIPFGLIQWGLNISIWSLIGLLISSVATLCTGFIMRTLFIRSEGVDEIRLTKVRAIRGDMINYTLPFLIGLFAFDYKSWQSILSLIVF